MYNVNFADGYYKKSILQKIGGNTEILTAFCAATNMPLVECSPDTFNDQVFVLESEDILKAFAKPYFEKKLSLRGIKFAPKDKMRFFTMLLAANIDEIVYIDSLGRHFIKVEEIVRKNDFSKLPQEKRPVENPQLLLSGIYFAQELSRAVPAAEKENLKEMGDEFMANLMKATLLVPFEPVGTKTDSSAESVPAQNADQSAQNADQPAQQQMRLPLIKTPQNDVFIPIFSDSLEFQRYNKENKLRALAVTFPALRKLQVKEAKGYMLNPTGFHLLIAQGKINKNAPGTVMKPLPEQMQDGSKDQKDPV